MLAYSSVENIGIILIGLGLGVAGRACGYPVISMFGFGGALLHIVNHAIFKGLLFLGAGSVIRQTGTGDIDKLGGLLKKLPLTGALFAIGTIAISGLPFLNGFISELFIYAGAIIGAVTSDGTVFPLVSAIAVMSLALIGGLAAASFTKVLGLVFQGAPRNSELDGTIDVPNMMKSAMIFLSVFLVFIGMMSFLVIPFIEKPMILLTGEQAVPFFYQLTDISVKVSIVLAVILVSIVLVFTVGRSIFRRKTVKDMETWGCGYTAAAPSMQYTSSSYASPMIDRFGSILAAKEDFESGDQIFPEKPWSFKSWVEDWFLSKVFIKLAKFIDKIFALLRWFQCGKAGVYVLYIAIVVIILIIWKFGL
jgi:NADH:ubiquinone oxidoreductase subunit 5 (subunit L)/multisubunit Na+/H+ antiporter MnhA subunit